MSAAAESYARRIAWFHQARFGMFIHFGPYALLRRGEWTMYTERMPASEYAALADSFRPDPQAPQRWVEAAVRAGMRYAVLTTRHHDGYCLFDSRHSAFTSTRCAARQDITAAFVSACRAAGLKVGLYYSLGDWRFPGWLEPGRHRDSAQALVEQAHRQVEELMTGYGAIDLLWYDGSGVDLAKAGVGSIAEFWRARELNAMVRRLQPGILINNRAGTDEDLDTPEQQVTASSLGRGWECCMTTNVWGGWGYIPHHATRRTAPQILQHLIESAAGEGNFLLNIGPRPDGGIPAADGAILDSLGGWLALHGEAIYGSQGCELMGGCRPWIGHVPFNQFGRWTRRGTTAYLHCLHWPGAELSMPLVATRALSAEVLGTGIRLGLGTASNGRLRITGLPEEPPFPISVIKVEFADVPLSCEEPDKAAWLAGAV